MAKVRIYSKETCTELRFEKHPEWRNNPAIQKELKKGSNDILEYLPDGLFGRSWTLERIISDDNDVGEIGDYVVEGGWVVPAEFIAENFDENRFSVNSDGNNFIIRKNDSEMILTPAEFWQIVKYGDNLDTLGEVKEYIDQLDVPINGVEPKRFLEHLDKIVERVKEDRIADESGDQIYYVLERLSKEIKEED